MTTLLIRNARCIATFDNANPSQGRELRDASIFIRGHCIEIIGSADDLPRTPTR